MRTQNLGFEQALVAMKHGRRVRRRSWAPEAYVDFDMNTRTFKEHRPDVPVCTTDFNTLDLLAYDWEAI